MPIFGRMSLRSVATAPPCPVRKRNHAAGTDDYCMIHYAYFRNILIRTIIYVLPGVFAMSWKQARQQDLL